MVAGEEKKKNEILGSLAEGCPAEGGPAEGGLAQGGLGESKPTTTKPQQHQQRQKWRVEAESRRIVTPKGRGPEGWAETAKGGPQRVGLPSNRVLGFGSVGFRVQV